MAEYGLSNPLAERDAKLGLATATGDSIEDADARPVTVENYAAINAARMAKIRLLGRSLTGEEALACEAAFSAAPTNLPASSVDDDNRPDEVPEVALARKAAALLENGEWVAA